MAEDIKKWTDERVCSILLPDIQGAESIQTVLAEQREDNYDRFRMQPYGNEREGFSQSVAPTVYSNHKWTMANLMEIFTEDFFVLKSDNEDKAAKFQKLLYHQMFKRQDGFRKFHDFMFNANLYHYAIFKVCYRDDFELKNDKYNQLSPEQMQQLIQTPDLTVSKYDEVEMDDGSIRYDNVKVVKKVTKYAGPHFEVVPNWEFFYSQDCKMDDWGGIKGRLIFQKARMTLNDVRKREKAGVYRKGTFEKIKDQQAETFNQDAEATEIIFNADDLPNMSTQEPSNLPENLLSREVEIYECYFNLDIDNDGLLEPVIVDLCGDVVCRLEENPYGRAPFRIGHVAPEPHKIPGISTPSILENDQKIATNLLRLIQDSAALDCYKNPVTNDPQMFQHLQQRKPFAVIKGDPSQLGEVKTSPPTQFILKAYELLKAEDEGKTGITRYNQGMDASSLNKTATGIDAIMSASAKPMRLTAKLLGNGPIKGLIRDFIFIDQTWPPEKDMQLLNATIEINPEDIDGDHEIDIDIGVGTAEKNAMANQMDLLIQFGTQAGIQLGIMGPQHVAKAQRKKYRILGVKVDELMFTDKEMQANAEAAKNQPPKPPDIKEYCQIDKIFPLLTPIEQEQVLRAFNIEPDPRRKSLPPMALSGETPSDYLKLQIMEMQAQNAKEAGNAKKTDVALNHQREMAKMAQQQQMQRQQAAQIVPQR